MLFLNQRYRLLFDQLTLVKLTIKTFFSQVHISVSLENIFNPMHIVCITLFIIDQSDLSGEIPNNQELSGNSLWNNRNQRKLLERTIGFTLSLNSSVRYSLIRIPDVVSKSDEHNKSIEAKWMNEFLNRKSSMVW